MNSSITKVNDVLAILTRMKQELLSVDKLDKHHL